jgi:hypothetical protein
MGVHPPSMVLTLEQAGLISRQRGLPRSIVLRVDRTVLPMLELAAEPDHAIN